MGTLTKQELNQFTGDLERWCHPIGRRVIYTAGVRHVAEKGNAYWLIDAIAGHLTSHEYLHATTIDPRLCDFMVWTLETSWSKTGQLSSRSNLDVEPWITEPIPFTDFPLDRIDICAMSDRQHWTLYLPSEH